LKGFSTLDKKGGFEEVSAKIRGAMKERGQNRRRKSEVDIDGDGMSDGEIVDMPEEEEKKYL